MINTSKLACLGAALLALSCSTAWADAQEDCERWARKDNVSAMLWNRYVESCVQSMQGEDDEESPQQDEAEPLGTPPTPEPPGVDLSY